MTQSISSADFNATEAFGEQLGRQLKGGEVIELISDLGGGKTTLTRGIVRGAGSSNVVGSPSFTLSKVYKTPSFEIHHFDLYRLSEAGLMEYELHDLLADPQAVIIIEWGDVVQHILPDKRLTMHINKTPQGDKRQIVCSAPKALGYLLV